MNDKDSDSSGMLGNGQHPKEWPTLEQICAAVYVEDNLQRIQIHGVFYPLLKLCTVYTEPG